MKFPRLPAPFGFLALWLVLAGPPALAAGGVVKFKTDNGPDGYYYNANGAARARYGSFYFAGEFDVNAIICGIRVRDLDQSVITSGIDDYTLGADLRSEDSNNPGYADISSAGLLALGDASSLSSCSTTGASTTRTFGGGAGVPDPLTRMIATMQQPANNNPVEGIDFCGILLDTSSVFTNSARTQAYSVVENPLFFSIGFNHFVELIVFEQQLNDLNIRITGSSRFPGDRGLPVMFARRNCNPASSGCLIDSSDGTGIDRTDDLITARITLDNNTCSPTPVSLTIQADRSPINPKLGPKDVTGFFRTCGGGPGIPPVFTVAPKQRVTFCLEIRTAIKRRFLGAFPVDLPFVINAQDPNDPQITGVLDTERQLFGLRETAVYYDNDSHSGGFFFSRTPVQTGDSLAVRYDSIDLPKPGVDTRVSGIQIVGGDFGASGLPGLDAVELRTEDPVFASTPDFSPSGLLRGQGQVGDPGNGDGILFGTPATTVTVDLTDFVRNPADFALAPNLFALAYLNPGDTGASVTAIGSTAGGDIFVGNSSTIFARQLPIFPFTQNDLEIRLDLDGALGSSTNLGKSGGARPVNAPLREGGRYIAVKKGGIRIE